MNGASSPMYGWFSHDEVADALRNLVDEGMLEMGVDESGEAIFWFRDQPAELNSESSLAYGP